MENELIDGQIYNVSFCIIGRKDPVCVNLKWDLQKNGFTDVDGSLLSLRAVVDVKSLVTWQSIDISRFQ